MDINKKTGEMIRKLRNANHMSLDELAKRIHKSKSSMSKYEQGDVKLDLQILDEIACALNVSLHALLPASESDRFLPRDISIRLFSSVNSYVEDTDTKASVYLYFYGGAINDVRTSLIELNRLNGETLMYCDPYQKKDSIGCSFFYRGKTEYFDSKYRITLHNHYDENDVFYIQCADAMAGSDTLMGLLSHFAAGQFNSFSTKCLLSKTELPVDDELRAALRFSKEELQDIKKRNALYGSNRPQVFKKQQSNTIII